MSEARFYCPDLGVGRIRLPDEEVRHVLASRRLKIGDEITVFNGRGLEAGAEIVGVSRNHVEVEVSATRERPFEYALRLTLATAVPKPPRQSFLIEKCTELGVAAIRPLECRRSVAIATAGTIDRWQRVAVESAKQCRAAWVPVIEASRTLQAALAQSKDFDRCLLASSEGSADPLQKFVNPGMGGSVVLFVGPEGGWEDQELQLAREHGAVLVSLGPRILRIETACLAVAANLAVGFDPTIA